MISSVLLIGFTAHPSAAEPAAQLAPPQTDFADEEGETLASIKQMPSILNDPETRRRDLIKAAFELRDSKTKMDEKTRWIRIDEYIRAADRIRSSTFTRCNLAVLAQQSGNEVRAADYFRKERENPLPKSATQHQKVIRDVCDTHAALAFERVGELNIEAPPDSAVWINHEYIGAAPLAASVFVRPNEEHNVVIELMDNTELKRRVKVQAGKSTTLKFQSPPEAEVGAKERKNDIKAPPPPPFRPEEDPTWKYALAGSAVLGGAGVVLTMVGIVRGALMDDPAVQSGSDGLDCTSTKSSKLCLEAVASKASTQTLSLTGVGLVGAALAGGLTSFFLKPKSANTPISLALSPSGAYLQGTF